MTLRKQYRQQLLAEDEDQRGNSTLHSGCCRGNLLQYDSFRIITWNYNNEGATTRRPRHKLTFLSTATVSAGRRRCTDQIRSETCYADPLLSISAALSGVPDMVALLVSVRASPSFPPLSKGVLLPSPSEAPEELCAAADVSWGVG